MGCEKMLHKVTILKHALTFASALTLPSFSFLTYNFDLSLLFEIKGFDLKE